MHLLITYDVATSTPGGQKRLRKIAKACLDYGQRVQYSVFECKVDPARYVELKHKLLSLMNEEEDSIRFYNLGKSWDGRVEHYGQKQSFDPDGPLIV